MIRSAILILIALACTLGATMVNHELPDYQRMPALSGTIHSIGSPTTNALIAAWEEEFHKIYPSIEFDLKGGTSDAVLAALLSKTPPELGAMSRPMTDDEVNAFKKKYGYPPTGIRVAVNALALFVSSDNPCKGLSLEQLDAIFSRTNKRGQQPILTWGDAGIEHVAWANENILVYTLSEKRGETGLFKNRVMIGGEFRYEAQTEVTSSTVVEDVAVDRGGIGYASIIYRTKRSRPLALKGEDGTFYEPTYDNCVARRYPLADFLYIYVNKKPGQPLDAPSREFLKFACCQLGQELASREGAFPLTPELSREQLEAIGK